MREGVTVHAVFFDDIRVELDDKVTLVGVHMHGIKVNGMAPAALPQLWMGIWVSYPTAPKPKTIRIVAKGDTLENPAFDVTLHPRQEEEDVGTVDAGSATEFITNRWLPAAFSGNGTISVDVFVDGKNIFAMDWPVIIAPSPNPQVPPAIKLTPPTQTAAAAPAPA